MDEVEQPAPLDPTAEVRGRGPIDVFAHQLAAATDMLTELAELRLRVLILLARADPCV
jgi:hypothetical protein